MDYSIANRTPDVAQAVVGHFVDADGNAVPQSAGNPQPVASAPRTIVVAASAALVPPASTTAYAAGDAVSNSATAASVTPRTFRRASRPTSPVRR